MIQPGSHEDWEQSAGDSEIYECESCGDRVHETKANWDVDNECCYCKHCYDYYLAEMKELTEDEQD